jgi:hypothetical protein
VEYFSGLENPLEGRQPLIEELSALTSATEFLVDPDRGELQRELGATWMLLASDSGDLGTPLSYGNPAPHFAERAGLEVVWREGGVRILRADAHAAPVTSVGPPQDHWAKFLAALLALTLFACAMAAAPWQSTIQDKIMTPPYGRTRLANASDSCRWKRLR